MGEIEVAELCRVQQPMAGLTSTSAYPQPAAGKSASDIMSIEDKRRIAHEALVIRVLGEDGRASRHRRRAAFDNARLPEPLRTLISKVAEQPTRVNDEEMAAVKASGLDDDQVFELVVCAAVGQATRQYATALAALDEAVSDEVRSEHAS